MSESAAQDHVVCGPDCQCGCEAGRTIPVRSAAQGRPKSLGEATGPTGRGEAGGRPKPTAANTDAPRKSKRKPTRAKGLGVTDADYARMLAAQDGMCAIFGCLRTPKTRRFHVDHDHATGQVRGLLCHWHNRIMPRTSDEAFAMAAYLARFEP